MNGIGNKKTTNSTVMLNKTNSVEIGLAIATVISRSITPSIDQVLILFSLLGDGNNIVDKSLK